jgi:hypothetical protein
MRWAYEVLAAWYVAAAVGGLLIFAAERISRREPAESDVSRAAERYRQCYGAAAGAVIAEHIFAASFAPDSRYRKFLARVAHELRCGAIDKEHRRSAIDASAKRQL